MCVFVCLRARVRVSTYYSQHISIYSPVHTRSAPRSSVTAFVVQDIIRVILLPLCIAVMCVTRRRLTGDTPNRIILWFFRVLVIVGMLEVIEVRFTYFVRLPPFAIDVLRLFSYLPHSTVFRTAPFTGILHPRPTQPLQRYLQRDSTLGLPHPMRSPKSSPAVARTTLT